MLKTLSMNILLIVCIDINLIIRRTYCSRPTYDVMVHYRVTKQIPELGMLSYARRVTGFQDTARYGGLDRIIRFKLKTGSKIRGCDWTLTKVSSYSQ